MADAVRAGVPGRGGQLQAALVLLLVLEATWLGWVLLAPIEASDAAAQGVPTRRALDPLLAARAFGPGAGTASSTADGLALVGLRRAGNAGDSTAIIADAGAAQRAYRVGDQVRPGIRLESVQDGHVLLSGPGGPTRLQLPGSGGVVPAPAIPKAAPPVRDAAPANAPLDPRRFIAETGLRPRLRGGRLDGFTIIPRGDGRSLRSAGLQSGDVLLAVNGEELTPERMAQLGQMLQSGDAPGGATTLTVERDKKRHTVTLQLEPQ